MPCYSPLKGYYKPENGGNKFTLIRKETKVTADDPMFAETSCGQCIGCRIQRAKDWGLRCAHEMQFHENSIFVTLTYADTLEKSYQNESLNSEHLTLFWKRLRKSIAKNLPWTLQPVTYSDHLGYEYHTQEYKPQPIKYYACGEYGSDKGRPHYHAIIFGLDLPDRVYEFPSKTGEKFYSSEILTKAWGHGGVRYSAADIGTAIYISKYITKKHTGDLAEMSYFKGIDFDTGEWLEKEPEFTRMSLKPAIGLTWLQEYYSTELQKGYLTHEGTKFRVPRYYKEQLEKLSPRLHEELKHTIYLHSQSTQKEDDSYDRLLQREKHAQLIIQQELRDNFNAN